MATDAQTLLNDGRCLACTLTSGMIQLAGNVIERTITEQVEENSGFPSSSIPIPTGLTLFANYITDTVRATWDAPPAGVTSTELWYSIDGVVWSKYTPVPAPTALTDIPVFSPGQTVYAKIRFQVSGDFGKFCATVSYLIPVVALADTLVSYWKLDETAGNRADSVGSNTLTNVFAGLTAVNGIVTGGVNVGGTNDGLRCASNASLQLGTGVSFTIAGWFQPFADPNGKAIFGKWDSVDTNKQEWFLGASAAFANVRLSVKNLANVLVTLTATNTMTNGVWHHYAAGFDAPTGLLWLQIDGGAKITQACSGVTASTASFVLAQFSDLSNNSTQCSLDEVGFWKRTLRTSEALQLYNLGAGIQYPFTSSRGTLEANNWSARVVTNGGAAPAAATVTAMATFVDSLITGQIWTKMLAINPIAPDNLTAARTPLLLGISSSLWTNSNFVAGDLTVNGLKGNGSNKKLTTGVLTTELTASNHGWTVYGFDVVDTGSDLGAYNATTGFSVNVFAAGNTWYDDSNNGGGANNGRLSPANANWAGYTSCNRVSTSDQRIFIASSTKAHQQLALNSNVVPDELGAVNKEFYAWCFNNNGGTGLQFSARRNSFYAFHLGLTLAESAVFYSAVQALRVALGGGYV